MNQNTSLWMVVYHAHTNNECSSVSISTRNLKCPKIWLGEKFKQDDCIVWNDHNKVFGWRSSAISNRWFLKPTRVLNANGISITSAVFQGSLGDRPTKNATRSVAIGSIYVCITAMWSMKVTRNSAILYSTCPYLAPFLRYSDACVGNHRL